MSQLGIAVACDCGEKFDVRMDTDDVAASPAVAVLSMMQIIRKRLEEHYGQTTDELFQILDKYPRLQSVVRFPEICAHLRETADVT